MSEQRQNFIRDQLLGRYSVSELAERFSISRKTAHKWINRYHEEGTKGFAEHSRRPASCPFQTPGQIVQEILALKKAQQKWGARKLLDLMHRAHPDWPLPSEITAQRVLERAGLVKKRRRVRRLHPGCPKSKASGPNDIWAADYKGHFRLGNGRYCFPFTVSDLGTRFVLGCQAHEAISLEQTKRYFQLLFREHGLPLRIRTDNGTPFASNALARLSQLSVWWIKLGIYPELIEPGKPQQNGIHERMHRTLKAEATIPPAYNLASQQRRFDAWRELFNTQRPHEAIGMKRPAELYRPSQRTMPQKIELYDYPAHYIVRKVSHYGTIRALGHQFFVATPLSGDFVALEQIDEALYDLFFCFYHIGRYDARKRKLDGVVSKVPLVHQQAEAAWAV